MYRLVQPQCLGRLIQYFSSGKRDSITDNEARLCAAFIIAGNVLVAIFYHGFVNYCTQIGIRIRLTCTAMIYKKVINFLITSKTVSEKEKKHR